MRLCWVRCILNVGGKDPDDRKICDVVWFLASCTVNVLRILQMKIVFVGGVFTGHIVKA